MEPAVLAPINYVEPPADHWPRIFPTLAVASIVFGGFYALAAIGSARLYWQLLQLENVPMNEFAFWRPQISNLIDLIAAIIIITGSVMLLRNKPYETMIRGLRFIVIFNAFGGAMTIYNSRNFLTWQSAAHTVGEAAKNVTFPLLVVLILLAHRKAHPKSPLAVKPKPPSFSQEDDLPLLRQ